MKWAIVLMILGCHYPGPRGTGGGKLYVLPAWPKNWNVSFKLHAPYNASVEGLYKAGKLEQLKVTPASRAKDGVNCFDNGSVTP